MSLWKIAWKSIRQRWLSSSLTAVSLGLGVMLVVCVLVILGSVRESFNRGTSGYHLVIGKQGSQYQLVLNSVFFLQDPIENIPWSLYKQFLPAPQGTGEYAKYVKAVVPYCLGDSYEGFRVVGTNNDLWTEIHPGPRGAAFSCSDGRFFNPDGYFEAVIGATVARETGLTVGSTFEPTHGVSDDGHKHDPFTVVGILAPTGTPSDRALFINLEGFFLLEGHAKEGAAGGQPVGEEDSHDESAEDHDHAHDDHAHDEHEHAEHEDDSDHDHAHDDHEHAEHDADHEHDEPASDDAGPAVEEGESSEDADGTNDAEASAASGGGDGLLLAFHDETAAADEDQPDSAPETGHAHEDSEGHDHDDHAHDDHAHDEDGHEDHAHDDHAHVSHDGHDHAGHDHDHDHGHSHEPLPESQREVTSLLVLAVDDLFANALYTKINEGDVAQAVYPNRVVKSLIEQFVKNLEYLLLLLAVLVVLVAGVGILVSIYNSMSERRREIGIMRSLGARRQTVLGIILLESLILAVGGGLLGFTAGHLLIGLLSPLITAFTGVSIGFFRFVPLEAALLPALAGLASLAGLLPAVSAYNTDVAKALSANP